MSEEQKVVPINWVCLACNAHGDDENPPTCPNCGSTHDVAVRFRLIQGA